MFRHVRSSRSTKKWHVKVLQMSAKRSTGTKGWDEITFLDLTWRLVDRARTKQRLIENKTRFDDVKLKVKYSTFEFNPFKKLSRFFKTLYFYLPFFCNHCAIASVEVLGEIFLTSRYNLYPLSYLSQPTHSGVHKHIFFKFLL